VKIRDKVYKKEEIKPIVVLSPINIYGKIAIRLMKFAGWLFIKTGNEY